MSGIKDGFVSFTASVHVKVLQALGKAEKLMAKNEKNFSEADLRTTQMQADATR
ncbi:hypothetical protein MKW92_044514 [Papaver armeniacum]|nr:hypothetical protein MKW92_044514 [Papaver armeniacum]